MLELVASPPERPDEEEVAEELVQARRTLAVLQAQADVLRAVLGQLKATTNGRLLAANEQLVLAALHAEFLAETAISDLGTLARATQRDPLTDTPNRALMIDRMERALEMAARRQSHLAVLFVDIDRFKPINDRHGHQVGDEVLQEVARRLGTAVRSSDTVSRHGGDEFLVLLSEVSCAADVAQLCEKLLEAVARPCQVGALSLEVTVSLGVALYPEDGLDRLTLVGRADAAMYRAKRRGAGGYAFHAG